MKPEGSDPKVVVYLDPRKFRAVFDFRSYFFKVLPDARAPSVRASSWLN